MTSVLKLTAAIAALAGLAACTHAPIPVAENFPISVQQKARSAGHWQIMAKDVVGKASSDLPEHSKLFVIPKNDGSEFERAFHTFLTTEFANSGSHVQMDPEGTLRVSYTTQVVRHHSKRPNFIPGIHTLLGGGLWLVSSIADGSSGGSAVAALATTGAIDLKASLDTGGPSNTEMIVTTTVMDGTKVISRQSSVYYIEGEDASLFYPSAKEKAAVVKSFKVVNE